MQATEKDIKFMREALKEAAAAAAMDEVPIGAILVCGDEIISRARNERESAKCATRHAEITAIEEGCRRLGGWRIPNATLYVTLEPCPMCAGAIVNARIDRVVFGAHDGKAGAFGSLLNLRDVPLNHRPEVKGGVLEEECGEILSEYFKAKRSK